MGKIVLLDELTINKIAAGEVIERPASVVKEMLENSIDAGAKNITIEIKNGGISLIRITDDGCGISEDDMEIAFERHATSKIRNASDLQSVKTMGFRGEALASISAIANVEMISKTEEDEIGHKIVVQGGKVLEKSEIATMTGTKITVQNLFFNTPVRYKFLKKNYTEAGYIEDVVTRIALINKGVAIKLINNDKVLLQTTGSLDTKNLIYSIYGKDVANGIKEVEYIYDDIKISGVIGVPEIARSNRSNQLFFINGRFVRDKNLMAGIEQAYKNLIPAGKYAFAVLNLDVNPNEVDVNVHPAKLEVRFQDDQKIFKAVFNAVKNTLEKNDFSNQKTSNQPIINIDKQEVLKNIENKNKETEEETDISDNANNDIEIEEDKKGFGGLFKKFKKDKENSFENEKDNTLLEIFNARKLGENLSKPLDFVAEKTKNDSEIQTEQNQNVENIIETTPNNNVQEEVVLEENKEEYVKEEPQKESEEEKIIISNQDIAEKGMKLGETLVSSNTQEIDVNLNQVIKENVEEIVSDSNNNTLSKAEEVGHLDEKLAEDISEEPVKEQTEESLESTVPSLDTVEKITSKILEMKINSLDRTQMIDTSKVREAMENTQKITPEFANMYKKTFGLDANEIRKERELEKQEIEQERKKINVTNEFVTAENDSLFDKDQEARERVDYKFVGIAFEKYIIIEYRNEMYIIEEMSARERINLEKVKQIYYSQEKDSTSLLLPDIATCSFKEMSIARENIALFRNAGFDFEEFGENTLKLTAVPSMCEELNTKNLFMSILKEIGDIAVNDIEEKEKRFIRAIAVNSTVKPKIKLDAKEVDSLIQELFSLEEPFISEHGRPSAIKMSRNDIEKKFARRK